MAKLSPTVTKLHRMLMTYTLLVKVRKTVKEKKKKKLNNKPILPDPGIKPGSPALQADSLPAELTEKHIQYKYNFNKKTIG